MIAPSAIAEAFAFGSLCWWTVAIHGRGFGAELARHRAERVTEGRWRYTREAAARFTAIGGLPHCRHADRHVDVDGPIEMTIGCADDLAVLTARGHATLEAARNEAIDFYSTNSAELAEAHHKSIAENAATIRALMGAEL